MASIKNKISYNSPVILSFVIICAVIYLLDVITNTAVSNFLALRKALSFQLVTYIFAHSGLEHLTGNMTLLLLVGPVAEEKYGSKNLLLMIFSTSIISGVLNCLLFHTGILGASGIVFLMIILSAFTNFEKGKIPLTLILVVIFYLGNEIVNGIFASDNVSQFGHIAGGIMGLFWGFFYIYSGAKKK